MLLATPFTPVIHRKARPQGRLTFTYAESNQERYESIDPQDAPSPIRQGDTHCRPSKQPIVLTQIDPNVYGNGINDQFIPYQRVWIHRFNPAGMVRQLQIRSQQTVGSRMNIARGNAVAYGSLFELAPPGYDVT